MTICRKCGTSNKDNQKFCTFCHELLTDDPVELARLEKAEQKKQQRAEKKRNAKLRRWKRAPFLLILIGALDIVNFALCLDLLFLGIGQFVGRILGNVLEDLLLGSTVSLFGNLVYTNQLVIYSVRGLELVAAVALLAAATAVSVVMIVRMIKWHKYKKNPQGDLAQAVSDEQGEQAQALAQTVPEVVQATEGEWRVSYAELEEILRHKNDYAMPMPAGEINIKELYEALTEQLWEYDKDSVRRILSAMSASRLLLCSAGAIDNAGIFDSLCRAFRVKSELLVLENESQESASLSALLLQKDAQTDAVQHSAYAKALYIAKLAEQNVCFAGIRGVGADRLGQMLSGLCTYFKLPDGDVSLYMGSSASDHVALPEGIVSGKMVLPPNVWTVGILPEEGCTADIGAQVGQYCAAVYLRNSRNVLPPENAEQITITLPSVAALENAVQNAEQGYYLSDELWKTVDVLEEQMLQTCGKRFSNRTMRMLERYTSVYLACGGKQSDALDNGLASVILPGYAEQMAMLAQREDGESLSALLERTVGCDRLPLTMEVLSEMGRKETTT